MNKIEIENLLLELEKYIFVHFASFSKEEFLNDKIKEYTFSIKKETKTKYMENDSNYIIEIINKKEIHKQYKIINNSFSKINSKNCINIITKENPSIKITSLLKTFNIDNIENLDILLKINLNNYDILKNIIIEHDKDYHIINKEENKNIKFFEIINKEEIYNNFNIGSNNKKMNNNEIKNFYQVLEEIIKLFINKDNGLFLLNQPTGSGKTSTISKIVAEFISKKESHKRIIFMTNLKDNLNEIKEKTIQNENTLFINGEEENILEYFEKINEFSKLLKKKDNKYKKDFGNSSKDENVNFIENIDLISKLGNIINQKNEKKWDKENVINSKNKKVSETLNEIISYLKFNSKKIFSDINKTLKSKFSKINFKELTNEEHDFIKNELEERLPNFYFDIFPLLNEYKFNKTYPFIICTTQKFLHGFFNGIKNVKFWQEEKDNILIIDEIDKQKEVILNYLVENFYFKTNDILNLFTKTRIFLSIDDKIIPFINTTISTVDKDKGQKLIKEYNEIKKKCFLIENEYNLKHLYDLSEELYKSILDRNFNIFYNPKLKEIFSEKLDKNNISVILNKNNIMELNYTINENLNENEYLKTVINRITSFIYKEFSYFFNKLTLEYQSYLKTFSRNMTLEETIDRIPHINKEKELKEITKTFLQLLPENKIMKNFGSSIYDDVNYIYQIDKILGSKEINIHSKILNHSPEKMLYDLSCLNMVIGLSATAKNLSVVGNFSIKYLKNKLGDKFYEMKPEKLKELSKLFTEIQPNGVNIISQEINIENETEIKMKIENNFNIKIEGENLIRFNNLIKTINKEIGKEEDKINSNNKFLLKRYYSYIDFYLNFSKSNILTNLMLLNKHEHKFINNIFSILNQILNLDIKFITTNSKGMKILIPDLNQKNGSFGETEIFENINEIEYNKEVSKDIEIKNFAKDLKNGKKCILITTYQTSGLGVNLQYNYSKTLKDKIKIFNPENKYLKDFDSIYLSTPTNLINVDDDVKYFYYLLSLYEEGIIIEKDIKNYLQLNIDKRQIVFKSYYKKTEDSSYYILKTLNQAIGRITRVKNSMEEKFIWFDKEIASYINKEILNNTNYYNELKTNEFDSFIKKILNIEDIKQITKLTNTKCNLFLKINNQYQNFIEKELLYNLNKGEENIKEIAKKQWQKLRKQILMFPITNDVIIQNSEDFKNIYDMYLKFEENTKHYSIKFNQNELEDIDNSLKYNKKYEFSFLNKYLNIPYIKEYFIKNQYMIDFEEKGNYIIPPYAFDYIYKPAIAEQIFKATLLNNNINDIIEDETEKFDFIVNSLKLKIDVKFFSDFSITSKELNNEIKIKILNDRINYIDLDNEKMVYLNLEKTESINEDIIYYKIDVKNKNLEHAKNEKDSNVIVIPWLLDEFNNFNNYAINKLLEGN
jgi:hypothetical protein